MIVMTKTRMIPIICKCQEKKHWNLNSTIDESRINVYNANTQLMVMSLKRVVDLGARERNVFHKNSQQQPFFTIPPQPFLYYLL